MASNEFIDFDNVPEVSFYDYDSGTYENENIEPDEQQENEPDDLNEDYPDFGEDKDESSFDEEDNFEDFDNEEQNEGSLLDEYFESLDFETYKEAE
jgi:hypothetical protein